MHIVISYLICFKNTQLLNKSFICFLISFFLNDPSRISISLIKILHQIFDTLNVICIRLIILFFKYAIQSFKSFILKNKIFIRVTLKTVQFFFYSHGLYIECDRQQNDYKIKRKYEYKKNANNTLLYLSSTLAYYTCTYQHTYKQLMNLFRSYALVYTIFISFLFF